jgi:hypothetical protein
MSNKEKPYLRLVRTPPPQTADIEEPSSSGPGKGLSFSERLHWRGIEPKSAILALTSLSIICAAAVVLLLAAALSLIN